MPDRAIHLVGSYPAEDAHAAMLDIGARVGQYLRRMPDGETGERSSWLVNTVERLREHPDFRLRSDGDWSDYKHCPTFRAVNPLRAEAIPLSLAADARESYETFVKIRAEYGLDLPFQAGIPSDLDLSLFVLGAAAGIRRRAVFREAITAQVREIATWAGDDVVFQLECPVELVMVASAPSIIQDLVARRVAAGIAATVRNMPAHSRWGLHLCLGDLGHRALKNLASTRPLVALSKAVVAAWPAGRTLEFVHLPLASGTQPPPLDRHFYRHLAGLATIPRSVRVVAGLGHDDRTLSELQRILRTVESLAARQVDIGRPCGLGRQSPSTAADALERDLALATSLDSVLPLAASATA